MRLSRAVANQDEMSGNPRYPLIYDPQTAGGLLAAVDKDKVDACIRDLREAGYHATCVSVRRIQIVDGRDGAGQVVYARTRICFREKEAIHYGVVRQLRHRL